VPAPPGTIDDLLADARSLGWANSNERLLRDWHRVGLLGAPRRRPLPGGGSGQQRAVYSSQQRALFQAEVRNRQASLQRTDSESFPAGRYAHLVCLPVYAWAKFGNDWVDNDQLRRALRTSLGPNPKKSQRAARLSAAQFIDAIDVNHATVQARNRLRDFLADQLQRGRGIDSVRLRDLVAAVVQPAGLAVVQGEVDSGLVIEAAAYGIVARIRAANALEQFTDEQLGLARLRYNTTRAEYAAQMAGASIPPEQAKLFSDIGTDGELRNVVSDLLLLLGMALLQEDAR
jgi:hypothetical protein